MLLRQETLDGIAAGRITCAFRRWERPRVVPGTRMRTRIGVVEVTGVSRVGVSALRAADAAAAGQTLKDLRAMLARGTGPVWRIELVAAGEDPRVALRARPLTPDERDSVAARLARMDRVTPWTAATLALIDARPGVRAPDLAAELGRETLPFKRDVRKLKELGLTESLEVGYRLSPRGESYLRGGA
ncbi:hypothetical protein [Pseudonocardia sp. WMMC193]|uniref:hypothetical protein n=1 Tax=Pseudonocardia sp. WMMC193 TaxID=2911965 RepID=UPI001F434067|nr:hypothetical protein [Pseudonocardia sp. WMMC193]MCF7547795.1 hypothetical protein [Pseudonocardia sp. WMMC193]